VPRRLVLILIAIAAVLFLAVAAMLARVWSGDGAEHSALTALVKAEARGDSNAMLGRLKGCRSDPSCRSRVAEMANALRRPGRVSILQIESSTGFALGGTVGTARVAWKTPSSLPIVQCVRVRRAGDALSGLHIELLRISSRIKSDASCPKEL
jgi:hypothetical protein